MLFFTSIIPFHLWKKFALPLMLLSFFLLALLFIPELSYSVGGARRWLQFGPISFQPAELLKFSFIIYLASWLDTRRADVASVSYGLIPFSLMLAIVGIFLVMQPDVGTLGVIVITAGAMYFIGGSRPSQIAALLAGGAAIFYFIIQMAPYRLSRILVFLNPGLDPQGIGYQINQAFIAIGSGGFFGLGFGKSVQKYNYLPEPIGDSIFAIFAEEMGFIGVFALIALFAFLFWRSLHVAKNAPTTFGKLLGTGIAISIMTQVFVNMAAITGLLPLTGIPLPFVSYGGSSLMITLASVGVLLNISKYT
jgi:cell division protein FtsW